MSDSGRTAWRCFPWDPAAPDGAAFSSRHLVPGQTVGRFDLHDRPPVRYLAESPEHAIGEMLAAFRGTRFHASYLRHSGRRLAMTQVTLATTLADRIPDCTEPAVLTALGLRPDDLAHHDRTVTQSIARRLHERGTDSGNPAGLRWWSALTGAWHTIVVFTDRERPGEVAFGAPRHLESGDPEVLTAAKALGIRTR